MGPQRAPDFGDGTFPLKGTKQECGHAVRPGVTEHYASDRVTPEIGELGNYKTGQVGKRGNGFGEIPISRPLEIEYLAGLSGAANVWMMTLPTENQ